MTIYDLQKAEITEAEIELLNLLRRDDPETPFELTIKFSNGQYSIDLKDCGDVEFPPHVVAEQPNFSMAWFDMTPPELREPLTEEERAALRPRSNSPDKLLPQLTLIRGGKETD